MATQIVMDRTGDTRHTFDIHDRAEVEKAERLTVELARRAGTDRSTSTADLPKIEGKILQQRPN